ncbi:GNAT family N-acetyltransferase [Streptomyces sp. NPDC058000]|uniref:GNAT family N-acetyltransferase n=1 Tax=Streptomyces sp. NPDC058000 TaxID=3346299 RepID=UPI0036EF63CE
MTWALTRDPADFETAAGEFLRGRPVEHTTLLSVSAAVRALGPDAYGSEAPRYGWWRGDEGAAVGGAFLWTPPRKLLLSPLPEGAAAELVDVLARRRTGLPGVNAGRAAAEAVAAAWQRRHDRPVRIVERHRLYRLGELTPPQPAPPGAARPATPADREQLLRWSTAFAADIGQPPPRDARALDERIAEGRCTLWEAGGRPVAMAGITVTLAGMARVAPVYTPPELRGRGYAGALTAALSGAARTAGVTELLLFTDLANPTSNALYQRIGYRPVEDHLVIAFGAEERAS